MKVISAIKDEERDEYLVSIKDDVERRKDVEILFSNKPMDSNSLFTFENYDETMDIDIPELIKDRFEFAEVTKCYEYEGKVYAFCIFKHLNEEIFEVWIEEYANKESHIEFF
jgi:hypothetical protein